MRVCVYIYVYIKLRDSVVQEQLTQHCTSTILQ